MKEIATGTVEMGSFTRGRERETHKMSTVIRHYKKWREDYFNHEYKSKKNKKENTYANGLIEKEMGKIREASPPKMEE